MNFTFNKNLEPDACCLILRILRSKRWRDEKIGKVIERRKSLRKA